MQQPVSRCALINYGIDELSNPRLSAAQRPRKRRLRRAPVPAVAAGGTAP